MCLSNEDSDFLEWIPSGGIHIGNSLLGKMYSSQINIEIPFHIFRELKCNHMKTSKLLIERVMTRQYWEKRHARDKYRLEQGFSKYLNGSSVSRSPTTTALPNNQTQSSKTSRFDRAKCRRLPTKIYYQSPRKIFSQKCMSCCQIFRSLFHQMPFYGHDIYPFFRKKCDHKMVANLRWLLLSQDFASRGFWTLGGVTTQLRACRIRSGTPPVETNLHFQSFSGYVVFVCLSLPKRMGI